MTDHATLRKAQPTDEARLKQLWKDCFHDDDNAVNHFFERWNWQACAHVVDVDGQAVSMLMALPFQMATANGACYEVCYIYAFCTAPNQQGKGYGRSLLAWTEEQATKSDCIATVMVPSEPSLFAFYQSLGYEPCIACNHQTLHRTNGGGLVPRRCTVERYNAEREKWLNGLPHIRYSAETLTYQQSLCRVSGGDLYEVGEGIASVEVEQGVLQVKELLTSDPQTATSALLAQLGADIAHVRLPARNSAQATPFGVVRWLVSQPPADWHSGWLAFGYD